MDNKPMQLLKVTTKGLELQDETFKALGARNRPAVVVSIIGETRSGKSFLLNQLDDEHIGFEVGEGREAVTKGLWVWILDHPKKPEHDLILVDTEGLDHIDQELDNLHDIFFTLIYLLSSTLVFNVRRDIYEHTLEQLSSLKYLKTINPAQVPSLVVAVKDFTLKEPTDDQYLHETLAARGNERIQWMKTRILKYFPRRKCYTFGFPAVEVHGLNASTMDSRFKAKLNLFVNYIHTSKPAKIAEDFILTGKDVAKLVDLYLKTVEEKIPMDMASVADRMRYDRIESLLEMSSPKQLFVVQDGKIVPNLLEIQNLGKRERPAVVVSIIGKLRTGKSFLMNKIAKENDESKGFSVRDGRRAQTKGVWMWILEHPEMYNYDMILFDTEGFDNTDQANGNITGLLFTFTYLLSSALVINVSKQIDTDTLDRISSFKYLEQDEELEHKPLLVMVIRDDQPGHSDPIDDAYLEEVLTEGGISQLQKIKRSVKDLFPNRKCFMFPPLKDGIPGRYFNQKLITFLKHIHGEVEAKMFNSSGKATGKDLAFMIERYLDKAQQCTSMSIKSLTEVMKEQRVRELGIKCFTEYVQKLEAVPKLKKQMTVLVEIDEARRQALQRFEREKINTTNTEAVRTKLTQNMDRKKDEIAEKFIITGKDVAKLVDVFPKTVKEQNPTDIASVADRMRYDRIESLLEMSSPKQLFVVQDGKIVPNLLEIQNLGKRERPAVVVSIIGKLRTGKSFLMNKIAKENDESKGFSVRDGRQAQTKGVWMWILEHPEMYNYDLILFDTEGFDDTVQANENITGLLFTFTYLLSSALVINVSKQIDTETLDRISSFKYLEQDEELEHKPVLVMAIRDDQPRHSDPIDDAYLEEVLTGGGNPQLQKIKRNVKDIFPNRKCFTFPPLKDGIPGRYFNQKLITFLKHIHGEVEAKMFNSSGKATGKDLAFMMERYLEKAQQRTSMSIKSCTECMIEHRVSELGGKCFTEYVKKLEADPKLKKQMTVLVVVDEARRQALQRFEREKINAPNTEAVRTALKHDMDIKKDEFIKTLDLAICILALLHQNKESLQAIALIVGLPLVVIISISTIYATIPAAVAYVPPVVYDGVYAILANWFGGVHLV